MNPDPLYAQSIRPGLLSCPQCPVRTAMSHRRGVFKVLVSDRGLLLLRCRSCGFSRRCVVKEWAA